LHEVACVAPMGIGEGGPDLRVAGPHGLDGRRSAFRTRPGPADDSNTQSSVMKAIRASASCRFHASAKACSAAAVIPEFASDMALSPVGWMGIVVAHGLGGPASVSAGAVVHAAQARFSGRSLAHSARPRRGVQHGARQVAPSQPALRLANGDPLRVGVGSRSLTTRLGPSPTSSSPRTTAAP
jgi:hypothetical protein